MIHFFILGLGLVYILFLKRFFTRLGLGDINIDNLDAKERYHSGPDFGEVHSDTSFNDFDESESEGGSENKSEKDGGSESKKEGGENKGGQIEGWQTEGGENEGVNNSEYREFVHHTQNCYENEDHVIAEEVGELYDKMEWITTKKCRDFMR